MVVINTKKIFITILVSALLLVGSALTVFALESDFAFSAPLTFDSPYYQLFYVYDNLYDSDTDTYNNRPTMFVVRSVPVSNSSINDYTIYLTDYGLSKFSVNGFSIDSMYNLIDLYLQEFPMCACLYINAGDMPEISYENVSGPYTSGSDSDIWHIRQDLNNQFFNYESQYNTLNSQLAELQYQYNALASQYQQLLTDYQNLQIIKNDLQISINTVVSENSALNSQLAELQNQYNTLETQYNDLQTHYKDLQDFYSEELTRLLNENNELRTFLQNADTQINNLEYEINRLRQANAEEYMRGYTQAMEDNDLFSEGLYSIFSAPFTLVAEIAEIEIFGTSIVKIVGIVLLFVVLSIVLGFLWKILPLV